MAYTGVSDASLPLNVQHLSVGRRRQWLSAYGSAQRRGMDEGGSVRLANGVIKRSMAQVMAHDRSEWDPDLGSDLATLVEADTSGLDGLDAVIVEVGQECGYDSYAYSWPPHGYVSQEDAGYSPFGFHDGLGCATCRWYSLDGNRCHIVSGPVTPTGLSNRYEAIPVYEASPLQVEIVDSNGDVVDMGALIAELTAGGMSLEPGWHESWTPSYVDSLPDSAFAYIDPGGKKDGDGRTAPRSLRHFPYKDSGGKLDEGHVRDALTKVPTSHVSVIAKHSALVRLHGAARSLGVKLAPVESARSSSEGGVVSAARGAYRSLMDFLGMEAPALEAGAGGSIRLTTSADDANGGLIVTPPGDMRYWAVSSNNFFDNKGKEFPSAAQHEYVGWVWEDPDNRMPELQVWHTPDTRLGQADWVEFDGHFRHSTGLIDAGQEELAERLANIPDIAMSHGYIVVWDEHNRAEGFRTYEESILPRKYAGNSFTSFGLEEDGMAFSEPKKAFLREHLGLSEEQVAGRETRWDQFGKVLEHLKIDFHELEEYVDSERAVVGEGTSAPSGEVTPPAGEVTPAAVDAATPPAAAGAQSAEPLATNTMTEDSLRSMIGSLLESHVAPLAQQLNQVAAQQQSFETRVGSLLPAARTPVAGFDLARSASTVPDVVQTAEGVVTLAQHDANHPLDPKVLQAIGAGVASGEIEQEKGADWVARKFGVSHPVLNGQPTTIRDNCG